MKPIKSASVGVCISLAIFVAGAWFASGLRATTFAAEADPQAVTADIRHESNLNRADISTSSDDTLNVHVQGLRNDTGKVLVMVFDDAKAYDAYDYTKAAAYSEIKPDDGKGRVVFKNLSSGPYAIALFHDENEDYNFDMNGQYPAEGYGTSNANSAYEELSFVQASVGAGEHTVDVFYIQ